MAGKKYQSCLAPFKDEILTLRGTIPPTPYSKIADILKEKHRVSVRRGAIHSFLNTLAKGFKPCKLTESIKLANAANQPTIEEPPVLIKPEISPIRETPKQATDKPKISELASRPCEMEFSETYNLTRLPPEEAEAMNKIIEEKMRAKWHKNK